MNQDSDGPPASDTSWSQEDYEHPAAGWGAARSVATFLGKQGAVGSGATAMLRMNHEQNGFDCPGSAWPDDLKGLKLDLCENGVKHVAWEMTARRVDRHFGVNAASNAPRMLTALTNAYDRGAQIVHVNPLVEAAARRAIIPHEITDMALNKATRTSTARRERRIESADGPTHDETARRRRSVAPPPSCRLVSCVAARPQTVAPRTVASMA